jgi:hypothetical protein
MRKDKKEKALPVEKRVSGADYLLMLTDRRGNDIRGYPMHEPCLPEKGMEINIDRSGYSIKGIVKKVTTYHHIFRSPAPEFVEYIVRVPVSRKLARQLSRESLNK